MSLPLIVLLCGLLAALLAFAASISRTFVADPVDPAAEQQAVRRSLHRHPRLQRFLRERMDRKTAGGFMLTASIIVLFAVAFMVGSLLDLIDNNTWLANADHSVAKWGSRNGTSDTAKVLTWITQLGSTVVVIPVLIAVSIFGYKRQRHRDVFVFVAVVGLGQLLLSNVLKIVVHRDRPEVLHLVSAHGYSFPSGHTVAAASVWSAVALLVGTGASRRRRAVLAGAASLIALSVATSRALLGVHWISDVIAGLAIGWGWFMITAIVFGGRSQRLGDPATPPPGGHTPSVSEDESRIQASSIGP